MAHLIVARVHALSPRTQVTIPCTHAMKASRIKAYPHVRQEFTAAFHVTLAKLMSDYTTFVRIVHDYAVQKKFKKIFKRTETMIGVSLDSSILEFCKVLALDYSKDQNKKVNHMDVFRMVVSEMCNPKSEIRTLFNIRLPNK